MITDLGYQQSFIGIFKLCHSDKHLSPTIWRQKSIGINMEQNYVTCLGLLHDERVVSRLFLEGNELTQLVADNTHCISIHREASYINILSILRVYYRTVHIA